MIRMGLDDYRRGFLDAADALRDQEAIDKWYAEFGGTLGHFGSVLHSEAQMLAGYLEWVDAQEQKA